MLDAMPRVRVEVASSTRDAAWAGKTESGRSGSRPISNEALETWPRWKKEFEMQINNHTHWCTRNLKTFIVRVAEKEMLDARWTAALRVFVRYSGSGRVHGEACYSSKYVTLYLPPDPFDKPTLAKLIAHELAHCQGVHHRNMHDARYDFRHPEWRKQWEWAETLEFRLKTPPPTPLTGTNKDRVELAGSQALLKQWLTKLKEARNKVVKYRERVKYYEKKLSTVSTPKETSSENQVSGPDVQS